MSSGRQCHSAAIADYYADSGMETVMAVLDTIRTRMHDDGHFMFPVKSAEGEDGQFILGSIQVEDGKFYQIAFTSPAEYEKGEKSDILSNFIDITLKGCLSTGLPGFIINPLGTVLPARQGADRNDIQSGWRCGIE